METLLTGWGCQVVKASDAKSAQQAALDNAQRPSVLLIDYHLDSGNGIGILYTQPYECPSTRICIVHVEESTGQGFGGVCMR